MKERGTTRDRVATLRYGFFGLLSMMGAVALITALLSYFGAAQTSAALPLVGSSAVGSRAPDFTLNNLKGETVALSQLKGQPVLLFFWATW